MNIGDTLGNQSLLAKYIMPISKENVVVKPKPRGFIPIIPNKRKTTNRSVTFQNPCSYTTEFNK